MASSNSRASIRAERQQQQQPPTSRTVRPRVPSTSKRSVTVTSNSRASSTENGDSDSSRVRVAIRLRPRNDEDPVDDMDSSYRVELQPEVKKLKLRKNNWNSESYKFDEVFSKNASQKRVYEVVAKPVVESVLSGFNGTVMAYGQTGTGKTYTIGNLGKTDTSQRGIMVRAMEDILRYNFSSSYNVSISYVQLYLESVQDLLAPEKNNLVISEDPKTGDVSLIGNSAVVVSNLDHFLQLLQTGEANRHAANTKLNTESSRSHAILIIHVRRSLKEKEGCRDNNKSVQSSERGLSFVLNSKLLIVDLAGSERIDKSGSEGVMLEEAKFINLSLSSLGKCINALAQNCAHIPTRDSKLTRLLRDSFGGSARTSLIITIGPSPQYHAETISTIQFGQRAMKVVNTLKIKEEVDYESFCRKLENQIDQLNMEAERQQKVKNDEKEILEKRLKACQNELCEANNEFSRKYESLLEENRCQQSENKRLLEAVNLEKAKYSIMQEEIVCLGASLEQSKRHLLENSTYQKTLTDSCQRYENNIKELMKQIETERSRSEAFRLELLNERQLIDNDKLVQDGQMIHELKLNLCELRKEKERALCEVLSLQEENKRLSSKRALLDQEFKNLSQKLVEEEKLRKLLEDEFARYKRLCFDIGIHLEGKTSFSGDNLPNEMSCLSGPRSLPKSNRSRETISLQSAIISKILEQVGLKNVIALVRSHDLDVQIHALKVITNLASEDSKQGKIVEEGGLDALLNLLECSQDRIVLRLASGAIANLAMNGSNQFIIMNKGGGRLLANLGYKTYDQQTLRMVAGAIANLCGNEKLHIMLKKDGATRGLLELSRFEHCDVLAQVARGIANFAKCETRDRNKGRRKGKSLLIDDDVLPWILSNLKKASGSTKRNIELALCHLVQNEHNAFDVTSSGAIKEFQRISEESVEEDIRNLARGISDSIPTCSDTHRI